MRLSMKVLSTKCGFIDAGHTCSGVVDLTSAEGVINAYSPRGREGKGHFDFRDLTFHLDHWSSLRFA